MPTKRRLRILFVSAKPNVDFSTFYLPVTSVWRRLYSSGIRCFHAAHQQPKLNALTEEE